MAQNTFNNHIKTVGIQSKEKKTDYQFDWMMHPKESIMSEQLKATVSKTSILIQTWIRI